MRLPSLLLLFAAALPSPAGAIGVTVGKPEGVEMPPARIAASPSRLEIEIGKRPANAAIKLYNFGDEAVKVRTEVLHWDLDEDNRIRVIPPTSQSLDQWTIINPLSFTIPPHKTQTVRLSVRPKVEPDPGEHRGIVYFTQELPEDTANEGVRVAFRLGIVVYGLAGEVVRRGKLDAIRFRKEGEQGLLAFDIRSLGNGGVRLDGQYSIWPRDAFPGADRVPVYELRGKGEARGRVLTVGALPVLPVLPGTRRTLLARFGLPDGAGDYLLFVRGKLGKEPFQKQFSFTRK